VEFIDVSFTWKGQQIKVNNIQNVDFNVSRTPSPNGHLGMKNHDIRTINFERRRSMQVDGMAPLDNDICKLMAATEKDAYFDGEITNARADDSGNKVVTVRWTGGHICDYSLNMYGTEIVESFSVSLTQLMVDDSTFKRHLTT